MPAVIQTIRPCDPSQNNPFTICIAANPALYSNGGAPTFDRDPIVQDPSGFRDCADYIVDCLFGRLPKQAEALLDHPSIRDKIRIVTVFDDECPVDDDNALIELDRFGELLIPRRARFVDWLARYGLQADVVYAVSGSTTHSRASAYFASDDEGRPGVSFKVDGVRYVHRYYSVIPGTIGIHRTASSLVALHEFSHALSSFSNGQITDLYVDDTTGLNKKKGRPIPADFAEYDGDRLATDATRNPLGYPSGWQTYHCQKHAPDSPAVMDNFWEEPTDVPERCEHDIITRRFLLERLQAKVSR